MEHANEIGTLHATPSEAYEDKRKFVHNLGELLSQTANGITGCHLIDNDTAAIVYKHGKERVVNIAGDSYTAIIKDITSRL